MGPDIIPRNAQRHDTRLHPPGFPRLTAASGVKPTLLQALTDKRMVAVLFMSFASGLPFNLSGFTLQAWLASEHVDIRTIGFFSLVGIPYIWKFLWAPLLDRYSLPILGRRRGWILIFQACLAVSIGFMGFCSPTDDLTTLALV